MNKEAKRKVEAWRAAAAANVANPVSLHEAISLSVPPSAVGATFPGLTPFRRLRSEEILTHILRIPSVYVTVCSSILFGAVMTLLVFGTSLKLQKSRARLGCILLLSTGLMRFIRSRLPVLLLGPNYMNVSSSPRGPCRVINNVLSITNSHAGTHADMPIHFCPKADAVPFDEEHYTGDTFIVDIRDLLCGKKKTPKPITKSLAEVVLSCLPAKSKVWRLLFLTREENGESEDTWDGAFVYFEPEAVWLLAAECPSLLLVGTDAPSVDHPNAAPICEGAHGAFYENGIAILENLQFKNLYPLFTHRVLQGGLLTVFNPTQSFEDSRGCSVFFFPSKAK